jgi:thiol-disulfide isomerase/thioredoxin
MTSRDIVTELDIDGFKTLLSGIGNNIIVLKFTAGWCKPCKKIKPLVDSWFQKLPSNFIIVELDIDDTVDLYLTLKSKKMVNGIPALLAYYEPTSREKEHWFIPSDSVTGADEREVNNFFSRIQIKAATM